MICGASGGAAARARVVGVHEVLDARAEHDVWMKVTLECGSLSSTASAVCTWYEATERLQRG